MVEPPAFLVAVFANQMGKTSRKAAVDSANNHATRLGRDIGSTGTAAVFTPIDSLEQRGPFPWQKKGARR